MIFSYDNRTDWDWNARCEGIEGLSDYEKVQVKEAFYFLKKELGQNFLKSNFLAPHTLTFQINNYTADSRRWIVDLVESLKGFKHVPRYKSLLQRLRSMRRCDEALSVLETANHFYRGGFDIEFDPPITRYGEERVPDLKLTDIETKTILYCEVSVSGPSDIQKQVEKTHMKLFNALLRNIYNLEFPGFVHQQLTDEKITEVELQIKNLCESVAERNGFGELVVPYTITLGLCSPEKRHMLQEWANKKNYSIGSFDGPEIPGNEFKKMKNKIKGEWEQLPLDTPNIIMIHDIDFFYPITDVIDAMKIIEKYFLKFKNILAVIISWRIYGW